MAPVTVIYPGCFLAVFAAVLGTSAAATFCELSLELLPLATLIVSTLTDSAARLILAAQISHHHAGPVLHVLGMVSNSELLNQWEDIDIIGQQIFILILCHLNWGRWIGILIQEMQLSIDFEFGHEVRSLEVGAKVAVFGHISQKLQRHQNILIPGHGR